MPVYLHSQATDVHIKINPYYLRLQEAKPPSPASLHRAFLGQGALGPSVPRFGKILLVKRVSGLIPQLTDLGRAEGKVGCQGMP